MMPSAMMALGPAGEPQALAVGRYAWAVNDGLGPGW